MSTENLPPNQRKSSEEEQVRRLIERAGKRPEVPADDLAAVKSTFRTAWEEQVGERRQHPLGRFRLPLALAASLLLALAAGWWWSTRSPAPAAVVARVETFVGTVRVEQPQLHRLRMLLATGRTDQTVEAGEELHAGAVLETTLDSEGGGRAGMTLLVGQEEEAAGSPSLRLDAGSRVRLAAADRLELERGRLYVDSGSGATGLYAVEVRTPLGVVRDIGTQFEVALTGRAELALRVRVREGEVRVERGDSNYRAGAGDELTLHADGTVVHRSIAAAGPVWDWTLELGPRFDGGTLEELLAWMARESGWEIRFEDESLRRAAGAETLEGVPPDELTPDDARVLLPAWGLRSRLEDGVLILSRAEATR